MNALVRSFAPEGGFPTLNLPDDMPAHRRERMAVIDREASRWAEEYLAGRDAGALAAELRTTADGYVAAGGPLWLVDRCRTHAALLEIDPRLIALLAVDTTHDGILAFDLSEYAGFLRRSAP